MATTYNLAPADLDGIGGRLGSICNALGISLRQLDRAAGRPQGHARQIICGKRKHIEVDTATAYADAIGCSLDWLIAGRGRKPSTRRSRHALGLAPAETRTTTNVVVRDSRFRRCTHTSPVQVNT